MIRNDDGRYDAHGHDHDSHDQHDDGRYDARDEGRYEAHDDGRYDARGDGRDGVQDAPRGARREQGDPRPGGWGGYPGPREEFGGRGPRRGREEHGGQGRDEHGGRGRDEHGGRGRDEHGGRVRGEYGPRPGGWGGRGDLGGLIGLFTGDGPFGSSGPFGPNGPFGSNGPFGEDGPFGPRGPFGGPGRAGNVGPIGHVHEEGHGRRAHRGHRGGARGGRGGRARRGDVRLAILGLLAEKDRNGYQLIRALEERTGGVWRPSPGAIYPALNQLEDEGLIAPADGGGKVFTLTDAGRSEVAELQDQARPWEGVAREATEEAEQGMGGTAELWIALGQLGLATRAVGQAGDANVSRAAIELLEESRRGLYRLLAEDRDDNRDDDQDDDQDDIQDVTSQDSEEPSGIADAEVVEGEVMDDMSGDGHDLPPRG